ncbi:TetR family transcriptional regulator [Rhodopseudomonas palustris]|uniref:TetR family transcriptional regulator n=1 Tax=Rhodopseudomonas palustris TaxID=1076 RepID=A0A0D7EXL9_RHOPL|nr:TetR family transcriptional regulator [Rhodopseudomonas palustris]
MATASPTRLTPRKSPRQARATATLEAILEATIQVLVVTGPARLTTTRVAERAGVSVGTMYQYFPNKQALMYAVTEQYLGIVADSVEQACRQHHGAPIGQMAEALVEALWHANVVRCDATRALYLVAAEVDTAALVEHFFKRVEIATAAMFATAADAEFVDLAIVNLTLLNSLFGTIRSLFDRSLPKPWACGLQQQLIFMSRSYLEAAKTPFPAAAS